MLSWPDFDLKCCIELGVIFWVRSYVLCLELYFSFLIGLMMFGHSLSASPYPSIVCLCMLDLELFLNTKIWNYSFNNILDECCTNNLLFSMFILFFSVQLLEPHFNSFCFLLKFNSVVKTIVVFETVSIFL